MLPWPALFSQNVCLPSRGVPEVGVEPPQAVQGPQLPCCGGSFLKTGPRPPSHGCTPSPPGTDPWAQCVLGGAVGPASCAGACAQAENPVRPNERTTL